MNNKISYMQGIRAICFISVALVHFFGVFYQNGNNFLVSPIGRLIFTPFRGSTGVVLFAILGGYFAVSYQKNHSNDLGKYLFFRYIKIWIAVLVIAILRFIMSKIFAFYGVDSQQLFVVERYNNLHQYIINSFLINDRTLGVFWPLLSIFIGTVIVSLINKICKLTLQKYILLLAVAIFTYFLDNKIIDIVCLGGMLRLFELNTSLYNYISEKIKYFLFVVGWIIMSIDDHSTKSGFLILSIGALMLLIALPNIKVIRKLLSNRLLTNLGNISFEFYCIHFIVVFIIYFLCYINKLYYFPNFPRKILLFLIPLYFVVTYVFAIGFKLITSYIYKVTYKYFIAFIDFFSNIYVKFRQTIDEKDVYFFIIIGTFLVLLLTYVVNSSLGTQGWLGTYSTDYLVHNKAAETIFDGMEYAPNIYMRVVYTYPLYHITSKIISIITGLSIHISSGIAISIYLLITILLVRHFLISNSSFKNKNIINTLSITSVILINLYIPGFIGTVYYPQGAPNLWHNPTFLVARPFAILTACQFIKFFKNKNFSNKDVLLMAVTLFLCLLSKPNYAIIFYPIAGIMVLIKFLINPKHNFKQMVYWGLAILPSLLLNIIQYLNMYLTERNGSIFQFKWALQQGFSYLFIMIIFPLFVFFAYGYKKIKDEASIFIWGTVILGWIEYFITPLADFIWGYEMAAFMLIVYSAKLLFIESTNKKLKIIGASIWTAQTLLGLLYFISGLLGSSLIY